MVRLIKFLSLCGFLSLVISLIILSSIPTENGFEISIYDAFPIMFWFFFLLGFLLGLIVIFFHSIFKIRGPYWIVGFFLSSMTLLVLVFLRTLRGYPFADPQDLNQHYSSVQQIVSTGFLQTSDFYPIIHIHSAICYYILNIKTVLIADIITLCFLITSIIFIYLITRCISKSNRVALFCLCFACIPIFGYGYYYHPSVLSIFFLLIILYLIFKNEIINSHKEIVALLFIFGICINFFHPITAIFLIVILFSFSIYFFIHPHIIKKIRFVKMDSKIEIANNLSIIALCLTIIFFMWYLYFSFIGGNIRKIFEFVIEGDGSSTFITTSNLLERSGLSFYQIFTLFINMYGVISVYLIITVFGSVLYIAYNIKSKKVINSSYFVLILLFGVTSAISFLLYFTQTVESDLIRIFRIPILIATILSGILLYNIYDQDIFNTKYLLNKNILIILFVFLMTFLIFFSFQSYYTSPAIAKSNYQITYMEIEGTQWMVNFANKDIVTSICYIPVRFLQYRLFPISEWNEKSLTFEFTLSHYDYSHYSQGEKQNYIFTGLKDIQYPLVYPENVRDKILRIFTNNDLNKLIDNPNYNFIYSSKEIQIFLRE